MSVRSLAALAFVPEQDVANVFEHLITDEKLDLRVQPVVDYFTILEEPPCFQLHGGMFINVL